MLANKFGDKTDDAGTNKGDKGSKGSDDSPPIDDGGGDDDLGGGLEEPDEKDKGKGPDLSWFSPAYEVGRILMREKEERKKKSGNKI
jgi:hypothetical protein